MSDTDSFLQEVSEELRRDKLYRNIRKYGWVAILIVIVIMVTLTVKRITIRRIVKPLMEFMKKKHTPTRYQSLAIHSQ